ncbi:hypothetical protein GBA52_008086 [Prunus armeniaca]|nr:hypothetical protein GBA52_008086 [Prunus armeniaca]
MAMHELMTRGAACVRRLPRRFFHFQFLFSISNFQSSSGLNNVIFSGFRLIHKQERLKEIPHPRPQLLSRNFIQTLMATCCTKSERRLTRMSLRRTKRPFQGQPNHIGMI